MLAGDDVEQLRHLYSEEGFEQPTRELGYVMPYSVHWQAEGAVREGDPEAIAAIIDSAAVLAFRKEELGEDSYPAVRDVPIETVVIGLTTTSARDETEPSGWGV